MPVIVHAYPNGSLVPAAERYTAPRVAYASRLAAELGVDIVKTFYTGSAESFAQVVAAASAGTWSSPPAAPAWTRRSTASAWPRTWWQPARRASPSAATSGSRGGPG